MVFLRLKLFILPDLRRYRCRRFLAGSTLSAGSGLESGLAAGLALAWPYSL